MALVASIEVLEITITGTNTTGTGTLTLGQDPDQCVPLEPSFRAGSTASTLFRERDVRITISGTTVTATRNTGTDIGTITITVPIVEFDPSVLVQTGTASIDSGNTVGTATLPIEATDIEFMFMTFGSTSTHSGDTVGTTRCRGEVTGIGELTFTRAGTSSAITIQWYTAECFSEEFSVQRGTITLGSGVESNTGAISAVDVDATFIHSSYTGTSLNDWRDVGARTELTDTDTVTVYRGNGGSAGSNSLIVAFEAVTLNGGQLVQHGTITITGTSATATLGTAVDLDMATIHGTTIFGTGEGNSTSGSDQCGLNAQFDLTGTTTARAQVVTDITPDGVYGFVVIDWTEGGGGGTSHTHDANEPIDVFEASILDRTLATTESIDVIESANLDRAFSQSENVDAIETYRIDRVLNPAENVDVFEAARLDRALNPTEGIDVFEATRIDRVIAITESVDVVETHIVDFTGTTNHVRDFTERATVAELASLDRTMVFVEPIDVLESSVATRGIVRDLGVERIVAFEARALDLALARLEIATVSESSSKSLAIAFIEQATASESFFQSALDLVERVMVAESRQIELTVTAEEHAILRGLAATIQLRGRIGTIQLRGRAGSA